jgi:hypothetical protein
VRKKLGVYPMISRLQLLIHSNSREFSSISLEFQRHLLTVDVMFVAKARSASHFELSSSCTTKTAMTRKQNDREVITESDQILTSEALN